MAEDDPTLRWALVWFLGRAGAHVRDAANGDQAITIAAAEHVDLLLTDIEMPGCGGAAVARAIKELYPNVAVVFMSGRPHEDHLASGRLTRTDRFIAKPFSMASFTEIVAEMLAGTPARR